MRDGQAHYEQFEASELFCSKCRKAQPVRKRLLLVLPQGNKFDYACGVCGNSVGSKMDDDTESFSVHQKGDRPWHGTH